MRRGLGNGPWPNMRSTVATSGYSMVSCSGATMIGGSQGPDPPETWTARHGIYLLDGYVPDEQGRVLCGGPY
jgi:predicted ATPase with chaperone activity